MQPSAPDPDRNRDRSSHPHGGPGGERAPEGARVTAQAAMQKGGHVRNRSSHPRGGRGACATAPDGLCKIQGHVRNRPSWPCRKQGHMRNRPPIRMKFAARMQNTGAYEEISPASEQALFHPPSSGSRAFIRNGPRLLICPRFLYFVVDFHSKWPAVTHVPQLLALAVGSSLETLAARGQRIIGGFTARFLAQGESRRYGIVAFGKLSGNNRGTGTGRQGKAERLLRV